MQLFYHIARFTLAAILFFAAAIYFGYLPPPQQDMFTEQGWMFLQALMNTGYLWPTIGGICVLSGIAFIMNRYVALASMMLLPITVNMALFHIFLEPTPLTTNAFPAYAMFLLNIFLLWASRSRYEGLLLQ